ncbi:MAG: hypothetical protein [Enterobacter phage ENC19]|nr:MAG: hypothetical protein [Enterobacter phage ENC19]
MMYPKLSGAEIDVLYKLYGYATKVLDLDFNDVPSKSGRDALIQKGYARRVTGYHDNSKAWLLITPLGIDAYRHGIKTEWH